jgi:hypothetical protein
LQLVKTQGIAFKNRLDQLNTRKCVAVVCAGAAEVCSVRAPVHRTDLWTSALASAFPELSVVAVKLMSMHVASCASERNLSKFGRLYDKLRGRLRIEAAKNMVFVAQNRQAMFCEGTERRICWSALRNVSWLMQIVSTKTKRKLKL